MIKKFIKLSILLSFILVIIIAYLGFFGINTKKFNNKIKSEVSKINKKVNLELRSVKFLLNPLDLSIDIKTYGPRIDINKNKIELEYIKTNISIISFINKKFSLDNMQISSKAIKLKDLVLLSRSVKNSPELFLLNNIIKDGFLNADININFDSTGKIKKDYEIKGFIKKSKLDVLSKYSVNDLNFIFNIKDKQYNLRDIEGNFNQIGLIFPSIKIKKKDNQFLINGKLINKAKDINIRSLNNFLGNSFKNDKIEKINFSSDNDFTFTRNKKLKISNFNLKSIINLDKLVYKNNSPSLKKYLPSFKELIKMEKHKIFINYQKDQLNIEGKGKIIIEDNIDMLNYKITKKQNDYYFDTKININNNPLLIDILEYKKKKKLNSILKINGTYKKNQQIKINSISFKENENYFLIKDLNLNKDFSIIDIKSLNLNYINNTKKKNEIIFKKNKKKYLLSGKSLDLTNLIDSIINDDDKKTSSFFNNINLEIDVKIKKIYLDSITFVNNLNGFINFNKKQINKLNLISTYPNNKKLILTINMNQKNEKITTFVSGHPESFIKQYKFIKGFKEGSLDFYSVEKNGISNSVVTIDDFKIKKVPVFAKLLSLASLQGIADLLTGEGIRFTNFEMKFSKKEELMTIEEMFAIGSAVSILMDGYIEGKKLVSLRGTLVPATTINRTISLIPLFGDILVGKKVGEGVFGVSFKIKGPPTDLKTIVNPVKTLTPRFITRTLEKIKKN